MNDAKARFFERMDNDMAGGNEASESERNIDIDFSLTESGRTVAHMVTDTNRSMDSMMDFNVTKSARSTGPGGEVAAGDFTESEQEDFVKMFGAQPPSNADGLPPAAKASTATRGVSKSIPVPHVNASQQHQPTSSLLSQQKAAAVTSPSLLSVPSQQPPSAESSYGSSGSAFLSSVLNYQASSFAGSQLSHTPPAASSYEVSHFGKRPRSGSVSSRLRSASDYFEEKGLLDRQTKVSVPQPCCRPLPNLGYSTRAQSSPLQCSCLSQGILKDLVIIGDEEMEQALRRYEGGDPSVMEAMIRSGALQNRLPKDLDLLGDLDFDFLAVHDHEDMDAMAAGNKVAPSQPYSMGILPGPSTQSQSISVDYGNYDAQQVTSDDGIGDLDFADEFVDMNPPRSYGSSRQPSAAASPAENSDYDRRMRSNSLFTALVNEPASSHDTANTAGLVQGQWLQQGGSVLPQGGIQIRPAQAQPRQQPQQSGLGASLEADKKRREKEEKREKREQRKAEREKKAHDKRKEEAELEEHIPGSGKPYPLDDPRLKSSVDERGLRDVERPDGWVGAYSPDSRKTRIGRFMEKRNHRVWTKSVKYDVRKNFADSRLRVKGRFVKKEDELLMRELMSLT
jgi:hypothetical protein